MSDVRPHGDSAFELATKVEKMLAGTKGLKVAVMGCVVNGVGEGEKADFGIAGGKENR